MPLVGNGARKSLIRIEGRAPRLLPTLQEPSNLCITLSQKKIGPCLRLWARGSPAFFSSSVPSGWGGRRADKAHCPDYSGRGVRIAPDDGREASRPAPCGAPTRHLCL